ncbi:hypothetical protein EVAR_102852_1 [Eumeta japonica]|uniref:Uncharacterized protein n=1 Tax=Eumeta variegata TaxID=151549 RepID=A0A4C1UN46_EUMVA|nr:hypothetical protein EVAR_102852_1 [Eumeta japonica]
MSPDTTLTRDPVMRMQTARRVCRTSYLHARVSTGACVSLRARVVRGQLGRDTGFVKDLKVNQVGGASVCKMDD